MNIPNKALVLVVIASIGVGVALEEKLLGIAKETDTSKVSNDITTVIKEKKNKDGSIEKDTTIVDKSRQEQSKIVIVPMAPPNWLVGGELGLTKDITNVYTLYVNRRILGPVFVGIWASSQQSAGVSLALLF